MIYNTLELLILNYIGFSTGDSTGGACILLTQPLLYGYPLK